MTKEEAKIAVREAAKRGVKKILITHPAATFVHYSVDDMKETLDLGATFLEHTWNDVTRQVSYPLEIPVLFDVIKAVGAAHCIMSTMRGSGSTPRRPSRWASTSRRRSRTVSPQGRPADGCRQSGEDPGDLKQRHTGASRYPGAVAACPGSGQLDSRLSPG